MAQRYRPRTPLPGADVAPSPHRALPITIKPISKKVKRGAARFLSFVSPTPLSSKHHSPALPKGSGSACPIFTQRLVEIIMKVTAIMAKCSFPVWIAVFNLKIRIFG